MRAILVVGAAAAIAAGAFVKFATYAANPPVSQISSVYTANSLASSVSALDAGTLGQVVGDIPTDSSPLAVAVSRDGSRVYTANGAGTVTVIDGTTDTVITSIPVDDALVTDVVVSPVDPRVFATMSLSGNVAVIDTNSNTQVDQYPLPVVATNSPRPEAIDITPDGASLFVLNTQAARVEKLKASDGASQGGVFVSPSARELKVSVDGATLVVVGTDAPQFFATSNLAPIVGASSDDVGTQTDVAVAGTRAYVLNEAFFPPQVSTAKAGPKFVSVGGPTIDVYETATGEYVGSHMLGGGVTVLGIAVLSDAGRAFVSSVGSDNNGSVTAVNLATGASGPTGSTGSNPRRVAVKEALVTTPVVSYFLPRLVLVSIKGAGKDTLFASGFFDEGDFTPDYDNQDVTIEIGGFSRTFRLHPNKKRTVYLYKENRNAVVVGINPNLRRSSRGKFTLRLFKTTLAGLIDPDAPLEFRFHASGLPETVGKVQLQKGRYRINRKKGELFEPPFFPAAAKAKLGAQDKDTLYFRGGFATTGPTPTTLGAVRFGFGPTFFKTIPGSDFGPPKKDTFKKVVTVGRSTFSISINFVKEVVTVSAKNVELGAFGGPATDLRGFTTDVIFDAGNGAGAIRETIRVSKTKPTQRNY